MAAIHLIKVLEAQQIVSAEETQGKCLLSHLLHLGPYLEERNLQRSVQVDFLYDHLTFAAKKGFPWDHVCDVVQFAQEFLATATDNSITNAIHLYQAQSINLLMEIGERNYKLYTDFLFSTFFTHFQLYKYIMSHPRHEIIPQLSMEVQPPVPPPQLNEAKELSIWEYEQKLEVLNTVEFELLKQRLQHQEAKEEKAAASKEAIRSKVEESPTPFTKLAMGEMMQSLMVDCAKETGKALTTSITELRQDLDIKLQKTVLPRPAVLGPPPRYKPKSPIQALLKPRSNTQNKGDKKNINTNQNNDRSSDKSKSSLSSARSRSASSRATKR